ncbi:hypothetical protein A1O3_09414 [Capronia epimyces CBS 606.96]|uniref:ADP-ribosylation factor n=1 Tax=Capronia epimyces CBS 606.96 TaxID=1182542 RepID=W9XDF3_9EURO|nr:uncharacterized protein A1O3_09414 [Capronia epimyces CBS 606.96]EXJ78253.1 hypothetical protein A1O3_09414 [Capronia epimyces CBS 606.96]
MPPAPASAPHPTTAAAAAVAATTAGDGRRNDGYYDLDAEAAYTSCTARLNQSGTENFVVRFNDEQAICAVDVDVDQLMMDWLYPTQSSPSPSSSATRSGPGIPTQTKTQTQTQTQTKAQTQPQIQTQTKAQTQKSPAQTVWFNLWASDSQRAKAIIAAVAKKYDLSPRLTALLSSPPQTKTKTKTKTTRVGANNITPRSPSTTRVGANNTKPRNTSSTCSDGVPVLVPAEGKHAHHTTDVEKGAALQASPAQTLLVNHQPTASPGLGGLQPTASPSLEGLSFADVVNNLWHFCSVDFGRHYIYVGFNALFSLPGTSGPESENESESESEREGDSDKPSGQRIWTSLLLCDDGTVVSVFERPVDADTTATATAVTRRNVLNIFRHLSKLHDTDGAMDTLMKVRVRWHEHSSKLGGGRGKDRGRNGEGDGDGDGDGGGGDTNTDTNGGGSDGNHSPTEGASLLFYYLFDDWLSTYALIARVEHPYRRKLEDLRRLMFDAADVTLIKQVHDVGRQLTVLRLMYQSYELIVSRLLYRHRSTLTSTSSPSPSARFIAGAMLPGTGTGMGSEMGMTSADDVLFPTDQGSHSRPHSTVTLSLSAIVRFERLLDRIRLYALTEIEECLKEKESLVLMNFNLVALKESQAVERLTRTTILLAKATILFLPVSLMTAYFSIQLPAIAELYSLRTYWLTFLVVAVLSMAFLLVFGVTTHTVEGKTIYRSVTRMLWDKGKSKSKRERQRQRHSQS